MSKKLNMKHVYIIFRCEVLNFKISKSQKKILKRMIKFLKNELTNDNVMDTDQQDNIGKMYKVLKDLSIYK